MLHVTGGGGGGGWTEQAADHVERAVDSRRNSGGGEDAAVVGEPGALVDHHLRSRRSQPVERRVVSGGVQSVEQAGAGEHDGTGADAHRDLGVTGPLADPSEHGG